MKRIFRNMQVKRVVNQTVTPRRQRVYTYEGNIGKGSKQKKDFSVTEIRELENPRISRFAGKDVVNIFYAVEDK